eukprot:scaffold281671_cov14-Tisochrysis_lutea.AAC.1
MDELQARMHPAAVGMMNATGGERCTGGVGSSSEGAEMLLQLDSDSDNDGSKSGEEDNDQKEDEVCDDTASCTTTTSTQPTLDAFVNKHLR